MLDYQKVLTLTSYFTGNFLLLPSEKRHCQLFLFHHKKTLLFDYHMLSMPNTQPLKYCILLSYYTISGNSLWTFRDNLSVPTSRVKYHYWLHKNSPEHSSHLLHTQSLISCTHSRVKFLWTYPVHNFYKSQEQVSNLVWEVYSMIYEVQ
jgi:hypothetical protein